MKDNEIKDILTEKMESIRISTSFNFNYTDYVLENIFPPKELVSVMECIKKNAGVRSCYQAMCRKRDLKALEIPKYKFMQEKIIEKLDLFPEKKKGRNRNVVLKYKTDEENMAIWTKLEAEQKTMLEKIFKEEEI